MQNECRKKIIFELNMRHITMHLKCLLALLPALLLPARAYSQKPPVTYLFVGTYTEGLPAPGIYVYEFDAQSGKLKQTGTAQSITNPSFLTLSPNGRYLYACTDTKMPNAGSVTGFKIDSVKGSLIFLNKQETFGENPVYVAVHRSNKFAISANYTAGNVSVFNISPNGSLYPASQLIKFSGSGPKPQQDKAHPHAAVFSPDHKYIFFPDLGSDKIRAFRVDSMYTQPLAPQDSLTITTEAGSGPRHLTFHPSKNFAYCIEELSGTVSAYSYTNNTLRFIQRISSYSKTRKTYASADIHLSPDGLFLYASNREEDNTLSIFSVDQSTGALKLIGHQSTHGQHPRNFTIDPSGQFLLVANLASNSIVIFKRNLKTGLLTRLKETLNVPRPACLQMRVYHPNRHE